MKRIFFTTVIGVLCLIVTPLPAHSELPYGYKNDISGDPESYSAALMLPKGKEPFPVVVISHGRGGAGKGYYKLYGEKMVEWGFAAIVMDHYRPRGYEFGRGNEKPDTAESFEWRRDDLISLLTVIKKDDRLDNTRVTLSGWSRGAGFVMHGILDEDVSKEAEFEDPIKSVILYYPQSSTIFKNFDGKIGVPALFLTGSEDYIWRTPSHGWKNRLDEYRSSAQPFILKVYEGAHHLFDIPVITRKVCRELSEGSHCFLYDKDAHKQSMKDLKSFLIKYAK